MGVLKFNIKIDGIYEDGKGMGVYEAKVWKDFFQKNNFIYWRYAEKNDSGFLVNVDCGGMLHPMEGITILFEDTEYNRDSINELRIMFKKLADIFDKNVIEDLQVIC